MGEKGKLSLSEKRKAHSLNFEEERGFTKRKKRGKAI